ncbi:hypothetical protein EW146_g1519 [Bondarzewia mesenterica]|uniref:Uncharacterized protein n=1 Tax=Bondarzewia mesenterica TaxID=1095465 RepID=A0A4S4M3I8_9AGAM|nr:hypothetical protein EW146_g1519 [Bondarzewia mesenterica]
MVYSRHSFHDDASDVHSISSTRESFMDLTSPSSPDFRRGDYFSARPRSDTVCSDESTMPMLSPIRFSQPELEQEPTYSPRSSIRIDTNLLHYGLKPPLPTTPKPNFHPRPASADPSHSRPSPKTPNGKVSSSHSSPICSTDVPPTTNLLHPQERSELVRKARKLAQMFGQTPSASSMTAQQTEQPMVKHYRGAMSVSGEDVAGMQARSPRQSRQSSVSSGSSRRRSMPVGPKDGDVLVREEEEGADRRRAGRSSADRESFMELSDEDRRGASVRPAHSPKRGPSRRSPSPSSFWPPSPSPQDTMTSQELAEDERRRKREKLAKLHRFLGSRVPPSLVLGLDGPGASLPALPSSSDLPPSDSSSTDSEARAWRRRRRRSNSATEIKSKWVDHIDRVKEDLDGREKAINVRRAIKMEKMFGVQPPQTLYHTRQSPALAPTRSDSHSPSSPGRVSLPEHSPHQAVPLSPASPSGRNINQSAYINKGKAKRTQRPSGRSSPTESMQNLLLPQDSDSVSSLRHFSSSSIYMHYRHSLNSLSDILDRDDKESLAELHQYITNELPALEQITPTLASFEQPDAKTIRRRSLPTRTSSLSLASQYTVASPAPEMVSFQARRRRAAKLSSFFGVDYRDLIGEVLDSLQHDVEEEGHRGSLEPHELQDLLQKLRKMKTKRTGSAL